MNKSEIIIPTEVKTLGYKAFESSKVKKLVIPSSVTKIRANAFFYINSLEEIIFYCSLKNVNYAIFGAGRAKKIIYMRREQVNSNIFNSFPVDEIATCLQYNGDKFAGLGITSKSGVCTVSKRKTLLCKKNRIQNYLLFVIMII